MVVACCRFLCYFCRTGRINQRAMFEHLSYLLDNSCMLLCKYFYFGCSSRQRRAVRAGGGNIAGISELGRDRSYCQK